MTTAMQRQRPAHPVSQHSRFLVGRDANGRWAVQDRLGLVGGLFTDRAAAVQFALRESNRAPGDVACAPDHLVVSPGPAFEARPKAR